MINAVEARNNSAVKMPEVKTVSNWDDILNNAIRRASLDGEFSVSFNTNNEEFYEYALKNCQVAGYKVKAIQKYDYRDGYYFEGFTVSWFPKQTQNAPNPKTLAATEAKLKGIVSGLEKQLEAAKTNLIRYQKQYNL